MAKFTTVNIFVIILVLENSNAAQFKGRFAEIGELPYAVHLLIRSGSDKASCTGGLIDKSWIITAAHCLHLDDKTVDPEEVTITAGINDYADLNVPSMQQSVGIELYVHPHYKAKKLSTFDVGLVKLKTPFKLNHNVSIIEMEGTQWPLEDGTENRYCVAGGFGRISMSPDGSNKKLKIMYVSALHGDKSCPCTKRWQWKRLICLRPEEGSGLCPGDSGGVLSCSNKVVGIAHVIMDKRQCSFLHMPDPMVKCLKITTITFFMFTCPLNDWIMQYTPTVPPTPESCKSCSDKTCLILIIYALFITCLLK